MSKISKFIALIFPWQDFLYLLQLEEYQTKRYLPHIRPRLFKRNFQKRDHLRLTTRAKLIFFITLILAFFGLFCLVSWHPFLLLVGTLLLPLATPYIIALSNLLSTPLANWQRQRQLAAAAHFFTQHYPTTKVIGITGSYGKTTTKYLLYEFLKYNYEVSIIPDNINTTLGAADYLKQYHIPKQCEYLIVEMGAYERGDITAFTNMLPPHIAILTALGDQHLERFGGFNNLVKGKHEIFEHTATANKYAPKAVVKTLNEHHFNTDDVIAVADEDVHNVAVAKKVALDLGISQSSIDHSLAHFLTPNRRNDSYSTNGVTIIDNSYNISFNTARAALKAAANKAAAENKKLVVVTAGIAENGTENNIINQRFATLLNQYATRVILLPSLFAPIIAKQLTLPTKYLDCPVLQFIDQVEKSIDGESEILLQFPEHSDLLYL